MKMPNCNIHIELNVLTKILHTHTIYKNRKYKLETVKILLQETLFST